MAALAFPSHHQKESAYQDRAKANPDGNIDMFLLGDGHVQRAQVGLVGLLGVAEATVRQSRKTAYDQQYRHDFLGIHFVFSSSGLPTIGTSAK
jgi:hypothetical protein